MKKIIVFLMATMLFNITTAQELKWDKKKGGYTANGKKVAQLTKVKRGFGNWKGFELRNNDDELILISDGNSLDDTLGMEFVSMYEILNFPKLDKRVTMYLSEVDVKGNRYKTIGYGLIKEKLLNPDGSINEEVLATFEKKYHKEFEKQLEEKNKEIIKQFVTEPKIVSRSTRSRDIDADKYGNLGQDNKVIGKWSYKETIKGKGVNREAVNGMFTFRNVDGKIVAWTLKEGPMFYLNYIKDGKLIRESRPKGLISASYDATFKTKEEIIRKNRKHAIQVLQILIKEGVL